MSENCYTKYLNSFPRLRKKYNQNMRQEDGPDKRLRYRHKLSEALAPVTMQTIEARIYEKDDAAKTDEGVTNNSERLSNLT